MQKEIYSLSAGPAAQEELNVEQDAVVSDIFLNLDIPMKEGSLDLDAVSSESFIKKLLRDGLLVKFLGAVLIHPETGDMLGTEFARKVKNSEIPEIIQHFFTLNQSLIESLMILSKQQAGMNSIPTSSTGKQNVKRSPSAGSHKT